MKGKIVWGPKGRKLYYIDGVRVTARAFHKAFPSRIKDLLAVPPAARNGGGPGGHLPGNWPMRGVALACHPNQVAEANEHYAKAGLASYHEPDGTVVIPTAAEKAKLVKLRGFYDKDAGYSGG